MKNGQAKHTEPSEIPEIELRSIGSFPYSYLHYLRRVFALDKIGKAITPLSGDLKPEDDELIREAYQSLDSHLLCHADDEGYYVPVEFNDVIFDEAVPGGMLGSSQKLLSEIISIAQHIDVDVNGQDISTTTKEALAKADESHQFSIERTVWFNLFENCKISLEHNTVISFG